ncbi:carbon starvation protein A [Rubripirellula amarantea]|uniref:Carbon starvation protein A n=1 Tax=Rubripirellula amarantea TaxID=2527999 RepID=A0A5C5WP11_9BACT|nr:carbon starvation protein A [Rubripirellula amarantea]MDA8745317.1 carbon starvation protein A [Rubripirellula amarantea]TWT52566.1 Carbon starvation protein A [Rubripirellula amarantea]
MTTLLIAALTMAGYFVAYHTYGKWLARTIFRLDSERVTPAVELSDDCDFVPTDRSVLFGHHFTSIAGTGPIVGPAIAVMWGWLPALVWVLLGSVFVGAVHDFGALVVSMRSRGQTVGDVAGRVLNRRVRLLFLLILFMALTIVLAIFGLVIAAVFKQYPSSIIPCLVQIPIAVAIGSWLHRKGAGLLIPSLLALATMYVTLIFGNSGFLGTLNEWMASWSILTWVLILLAYSYVASVLPVWLLLQPRDYINSLQLITALGLVVIGLVVAGLVGGLAPSGERVPLEIVAPMVRWAPEGAPPVLPFLFITIACGACSGFHCLVSSGTSSKQIRTETDAQFVGYGSMLTEGFLATLVILACVAGLGLGSLDSAGDVVFGKEAFDARYATWASASGLGAKVGAFVDGSANFLKAISIPAEIAIAIMGVLVASFAGTTLDTACRLQRYVVQELAATFAGGKEASDVHVSSNPITWLTNKHGATIFAVLLALVIAALPASNTPVTLSDAIAGNISPELNPGEAAEGGIAGATWWLSTYAGKGGLILWPLFGATNQLLAGLAFLVISFFLWRRGIPVWFIVIPMIFMLAVPAWAMLTDLPKWIDAETPNWVVIFVGSATLILEAWMLIEAAILWPKVKGVLEVSAKEQAAS